MDAEEGCGFLKVVLAAAATASAGALTFAPRRSELQGSGVVGNHAVAAQPQTSSMGAATVGAAMLAAGCAARVTPKGKGQRKAVKVAAVSTDTEVETDCINSIRFLAVDAVNKAHCMPDRIGYLLFAEEMAYNPKAVQFLSVVEPTYILYIYMFRRHEHSSPAARDTDLTSRYSLLHLAGYDSVAMDETDGIEVTTGPLGMGISNAVGLAAAEAHLAAAYNKPDFTLIDHYTYTIAGDGCMQETSSKLGSVVDSLYEGISHEACAYAGHLGLGKLIAFYDDNGITIDGHTDLSFTEDVGKRFEAYGWQVLVVDNGDQDVDAIRKAIAEAKDKPTLIKAPAACECFEVKTTIGFGSPNKADSHDAHGAPLGADEAEATRKCLGNFKVPEHVYAAFKKQADAGSAKQAEWDKLFAAYKEKEPELAAQFERAVLSGCALSIKSAKVLNRKLPDNWDECLPKLTEEDAGKDCLNAIAPVLPEFMGGSADLAPSNMTLMPPRSQVHRTVSGLRKCTGDFLKDSYSERNFRFGIREFGMGAVCNALSLDKTGIHTYRIYRPFPLHTTGIIPYCATFTIFTDYMRSAIRIAALSQAGTIFVTTHDSIAVGEDGPTHQPIETIPSLRLIPDLTVMRPADGNETAGAYKYAVERSKNESRPTMMAFSRQALPNLPNSSIENTLKGAYEVVECSDPEVIIIGTGSEVHICVDAAKAMDQKVRVVSMPSVEVFRAQPDSYKESLLPKGIPTLSVEAACTSGWGEFSTAQVGINVFGASAPGGTCLEKFGFSALGRTPMADNVKACAEKRGSKSAEPLNQRVDSWGLEEQETEKEEEEEELLYTPASACPTSLCTMPSTRQRNTVLAAAATASAGALTFVAPPSTGNAARVEPGVASSHAAAAQPQTSMGATTVGAALLAAGCAARMTPKGKGQRKAVKLAAVSTDTDVETDCINSIRFLAVDAVNKANSGHPGAPMGQAPIGYLLFAEEMAYNPKDPSWCNRDRFVLSSGHGCMLQYSLLHLAGYDSVAMDDLKQFRQWGSKTPGHPENFETDGIEVTTGPLGNSAFKQGSRVHPQDKLKEACMGISNAVGLAAAEAHMAATYNKPDFTLIDHYTYTIAGDGCMQEGISHEACAYAGHLGLGKLIAFYDDNGITIDGHTDLSFTEDVGKRFEAYGWQVITVSDGDKDVGAIRKAIAEAKDKPTLIKADSHDAHGAPLGADEAEATRKQQLGWDYGEFEEKPAQCWADVNLHRA
ncbi:Transketolase [Symbiodinium microadriaticum]|uniref:Transketolase n=1 Tax=Symbiodinium microadriaticum TaxID=2951 RepID=A0A1Q9E039_SYMMI|nr:Transketolase [Symbiodinium microadriaticum]